MSTKRSRSADGTQTLAHSPRCASLRIAGHRCRAGALSALLLTAGCVREPSHPADASLRLVSTAPNLTECVCAIGAQDLLVGRTETCDYPPAVKQLPVTGGFGTPYLEPLLVTRPTHVLESVLADPAIIRQLQTLKIPCVHVPCSRLEEIPEALRILGRLTAREPAANALANAIRAGIATARADRAAQAYHPRVLLLFAPDTPITAGRNAFISELVELAGAVNVGRESLTDYYHVSTEWVLLQDPDIILCVFETSKRDPMSPFTAQTGWHALRAVRDGRVYVPSELDTISRPGPRVLAGLAQLKTLLSHDMKTRPKSAASLSSP